jgi:DNA-binding transcriptional ArsR family regulator/flagellar basal body-associated protein FliL
VSVSDEEPYSTIFASLKHPIRRRILRMLSKKPMGFSEILEALGVSSSFLTYHLENLGELVGKIDDNKYRLSSFGEAAIATMTKVEDIPTTTFKMSETKASETKPKKVVGRSVAIALGIICILLIAGLGGAFAYYTMVIHSKENELASANNTISQLNNNVTNLQNQDKQLQTWLDGNETLLNKTQANNTNLQNQIDSLNSVVTNLQYQVNNFHIGGMENSTTWVNNLNLHENSSDLIIFVFADVPSAGYVSIRVSSNNNSTYVGLGTPSISPTNSTDINFPTNYQFRVGFGGTVVFPVSPTSMIQIYVGISFGEATLTVTITYYY